MICVLIGISGFMTGTLVGIVFSTSEHAIQILPLIVMVIVIFGGLVVNLHDIPSYTQWLQYLSPIRHGYSCLMIDQLSTKKMHHSINQPGVRDLVGING